MTPIETLRKYWGFQQFRPQQESIIHSVLEGKDTLALLPTGGGKSVCFQVPALCMEGICLVVSPLIALMKDQVENLQKRGVAATAIYSGMSYKEMDRTFDNCVFGNLKLLYLSPERLGTDLARERIAKMNVSLIAVDEAHCVSQWGYDFRPSYLKIPDIRALQPKAPVLALTATATPPVVTDIQEKLHFKNANVFKTSFERKNLAYVVLQEDNKERKLLEILRNVKGSAVVYVRNRKLTKEYALYLKNHKVSADFYHAGLEMAERSKKQDDWVSNKIRAMVSTNAFGMGIDKPDVRTVVHMDLPDSLEAYFQEAGRAGRDGEKSFAVLLYAESDKLQLEHDFEVAFPNLEEIRQVYQALGSYFQLAVGGGEGQSFDFNMIDFCKNFQLDTFKTFSCLKNLEQAGWVALSDSFFQHAQIKFEVAREALYDFQLKNPKLDFVIKTLLRVGAGMFNNFVNLEEKQLAKFMKISELELVAQIRQLEKEGIVAYLPMKETPQITFLQERVDAKNLTIDQKLYNFRKERHRERIRKAISYTETAVCRSQQLLKYFGENESPRCGICDVCLGRTKEEISAADFERYQSKILPLLQKEPLTEEQILESFHKKREGQIVKALEYLLDEGVIVKTGDKFHVK